MLLPLLLLPLLLLLLIQGVAWCREGGCKEEDQELHSLSCLSLHHSVEDERLGQRLGHPLACYLPVPGSQHSPLPASLPNLLAQGVHRLLEGLPDLEQTKGLRESELRRLSLAYTCPTTTLWALELALPSLPSLSTLALHIVGARQAEVEGAGAWAALLAARLPGLRRLELVLLLLLLLLLLLQVLVGPEVGGEELGQGFSLIVGSLETKVVLERSGYKEYAKSKRWLLRIRS